MQILHSLSFICIFAPPFPHKNVVIYQLFPHKSVVNKQLFPHKSVECEEIYIQRTGKMEAVGDAQASDDVWRKTSGKDIYIKGIREQGI